MSEWLSIDDGTVQTAATTPIIAALDPQFEIFKIKAHVTSIWRSPEDQLQCIINLAKGIGLDANYNQNDVDTVLADGHHIWQAEWSYLNHRDIYVNPPKPMRMLYRYISPKTDENMLGKTIGLSSHMLGIAFDIVPYYSNLELVSQVVQYCINNKIIDIVSFLVEPKNGAVHVTCKEIV